MPFTKKEQQCFEDMFWKVCDEKTSKNNKEKLEKLADLLFKLTGNVNLRMWLFNLQVQLPYRDAGKRCDSRSREYFA